MSNTKKPTPAEVTETMIQEWKNRYGKLTCYKTNDGKIGYFMSPSRKEAEASSVLAQDKKPVQSNEMLAKVCFLGGDEELISEDRYFYGLSKHLQKLVETVEGELEEL